MDIKEIKSWKYRMDIIILKNSHLSALKFKDENLDYNNNNNNKMENEKPLEILKSRKTMLAF